MIYLLLLVSTCCVCHERNKTRCYYEASKIAIIAMKPANKVVVTFKYKDMPGTKQWRFVKSACLHINLSKKVDQRTVLNQISTTTIQEQCLTDKILSRHSPF